MNTIVAPSEKDAYIILSPYLKKNIRYFAEQYSSGYGVSIPESHIVRLYHAVLAERFSADPSIGRTLFDFGCGSGAHACFFASQGITVYGVDANEDAVSKCKALLPHWKDNFKAVSPKPDGKPYFDGLECDAVIGNQVLYYLDDEDLEKALGALHRTLKVGGVFIATMMSRHHDYFDGSEPAGKGLRLVSRARAISRSTPARFYINFTESEDALAAKFNIFQKEHVGYYDAVIREDLGSSHHYIFVGTKT